MALLSSAAVVLAPVTCLHILLFLVIFELLVAPALCLVTYDRHTLIIIGTQYSSLVPDPTWPSEIVLRALNNNKRDNGSRSKPLKKPRGKRAGIRNRLRNRAHRPPLPSILLANVQSLENKLDDLRARIKYQRDMRDCNIICLTETWLTPATPDHAIQPAESFTVFRTDRTAESGKSRGGGVCLMVNNNWCDSVVSLTHSCSPNLELLTIKCRPFYLPREITSIIFSAVYIPPQADNNTALSELHEALASYQANHRDAALIVAGDFNSANLKKVRPDLRQHITCPTRGERTLDHCYSPFKDGYKAKSHPPFGKSDHDAIFLTPKYKQRLKQEAPVQREVTRWSDQSEAALQDALENTDWSMFQNSSGDDINVFTEAVVGFIGKLVDDTVPKFIIRTFPNQKPWVDKTIRDALRSRTAAYNTGLATGNREDYRAASYNVRRAVKEAKLRYGRKLESQLQQSDSRGVWQGLRAITDYKATPKSVVNANTSLADEFNSFYARFEANSQSNSREADTPPNPPPGGEEAFSVTEHDVRRTFKRVNTRKAAGPDGITGRVLKACADQLAPVFTIIFNISLSLSIIPTCFKQSHIIPVPKKPHPSCLNDYRPVALTSVVMKCFERLIKDFITSSLPVTLDPLQFAYRPNRATDDAIAHILHTALSHLDIRRGGYVRLLFVDFSSAFNTIIPSRLVTKLEDIGLHPSLCRWILNFLTSRPQVVRVGHRLSSSLTLNTGAPQGCVLSPLLYSLYTYDCVATSDSITIVKFADDTVVVGLVSNNDERAYLKEIAHFGDWCQENNLTLNVSKTKELIVDFSRNRQRNYQPVSINGAEVERVERFKYLGVNITQDLTWSYHINTLVKKARQRLYHLRRLRDFNLPLRVLRNFYTCTVESILTASINTWMGSSTKQDYLALRRVVRSAERTIRTTLPDLQVIYKKRCRSKAKKIVREPSHPNNRLFSLLPSGRRYRCMRANTERMRRSFFPQAIRLLNDNDNCG